jgi:hypothetical protein
MDELARITARESGDHGVTVTVNVDGRLIDLDLTDDALRLGAAGLAAEIHRLTRRAAAAALAEGSAILAPMVGAELAGLAGI